MNMNTLVSVETHEFIMVSGLWICAEHRNKRRCRKKSVLIFKYIGLFMGEILRDDRRRNPSQAKEIIVQ